MHIVKGIIYRLDDPKLIYLCGNNDIKFIKAY